jgi:hypothetical protein
MVLKRLFGSGKAPVANTVNEASGRAYAFSPEHALAQYAVTGTMHNTFYATADEQLDKILALVDKVSPEFVAKTAVYCRERGFMKDVPALLVAYLAKKDVGLMKAVFLCGGRLEQAVPVRAGDGGGHAQTLTIGLHLCEANSSGFRSRRLGPPLMTRDRRTGAESPRPTRPRPRM